MNDIHTRYNELRDENVQLRKVLLALYEAGSWDTTGLSDPEKKSLWVAARYVLRLPTGYATELGVNG